MTDRNSLTSEQLRKLLDYDPRTGLLRWLVNGPPPRSFWKIAGNTSKVDGYVQVQVNGENYKAHRLIWRMVTGEWPEHEIDHEDRDRANNRWKNIRPATSKQNAENHSLRVDNVSGVPGVWWDKRCQHWRAFINHHGKRISLGNHISFDIAVSARREAEKRLFTHKPLR